MDNTSDESNKGRKRIKGNILAEGEVTGHYHGVDVPVYEGREPGTREFEGATEVRHQEHKTVNVPDGKWTTGQVMEVDHLTGMASPVRD